MQKYIRPSEYAMIKGINYRTGIIHFYKGYIEGYRDKNTGRIFLLNPNWIAPKNENKEIRVALYARVSSTTNKKSLDGQIDRLRQYSAAKGYKVICEEKEIASGLNDNRKKLNKILDKNDWEGGDGGRNRRGKRGGRETGERSGKKKEKRGGRKRE